MPRCLRNQGCGSTLPVRPTGCRSARGRRRIRTSISCKSEDRQALLQPLRGAGDTTARWHTPQPKQWRVWQRRPENLDQRGKVCPWSASIQQLWSTPHRCPGKHWQRCCPSHYQWRRLHTGLGWQRPYWQKCLCKGETELNNIQTNIIMIWTANLFLTENRSGKYQKGRSTKGKGVSKRQEQKRNWKKRKRKKKEEERENRQGQVSALNRIKGKKHTYKHTLIHQLQTHDLNMR